MWGDHEQTSGKHSLICVEKALENGWHHKINTSAHPLLIDANGDYVADLFGVPSNESISSRAIWIYSGTSRKDPPELKFLETRDAGKVRNPHSNAFVDLDSDGNADIIVTSHHYFELWHNVGKEEDDANFVHVKNIRLPGECGKSENSCAIGQLAFADFNLDGELDLLFPVCHDGKDECVNTTIYFASTLKLWLAQEDDQHVFEAMTVDLRTKRFHFADDPLYGALAPRVGDIDLDGYPDLLIRVRDPSSLKSETHVFLNVPVTSEDEIIVSDLKRGFVLQDEIMRNISDTVMATFFDLFENGLEDLILVQKLDGNKYRVGAFTNLTQDSDAYFVKVIVLSGKKD